MATCLVTVSGTSGEVLIRYTDATAVDRSIIASPGVFYLDDDGTDYTWTTLSGDATAASGCITITEVESTCYILAWEVGNINLTGYKFVAVVKGESETSIDEILFSFAQPLTIGNAINALNNEDIKAVAYKIVRTDGKSSYYLILKVTSDIPYLKINNEDDTVSLLIKGEETVDCLPAGYTAIDTCSIGSSVI